MKNLLNKIGTAIAKPIHAYLDRRNAKRLDKLFAPLQNKLEAQKTKLLIFAHLTK